MKFFCFFVGEFNDNFYVIDVVVVVDDFLVMFFNFLIKYCGDGGIKV